MSLPNPVLFQQASLCLKSFPLSNKALKRFLTFLIRQLQSIKNDEHSLRTIFKSAAKNRQVLDELWSNVQTAAGCRSFWRLTNDVGVLETLRRFPEDPMTATFFDSVIEKFRDQGLEGWAFETSNSFLIRDAICYSSFDRIECILFIVSAFPKFYSDSFRKYFLNLEIEATALEQFLEQTKTGKLKISGDPPLILPKPLSALKAQAVIPPSVLLLQLIPKSTKIRNIPKLLPVFLKLLQQEISHQLIFGCISLCLDDSWSIVIENFSLIIESISKSTSSHVHSEILRLIGDLARRSPEGVAVHSTALFTSLSGPTLFSDDTANLTKLKQLLSVILPALGEKVEDLLDYFSENLTNFSVDRACQLMVHSVHVLSENSFRVFRSLLRHNCEDFLLLLVDQLPPNELLGTVLNLVRHDKIFSEFVFRIQLPPIPDQLFELFSILAGLDGFNQFFEQTCDSFLISDFVELMNVLIPTNIEITELIGKRISVEPSSQFGLLIPTLLKQLQLSQFLSSTMSILSDITLVLTMSNDILEIVKAIMNGIDNDRYTIPNKVQALCLMSSIIEKFNIKMLPIFQSVINFAAELYSFLVNENIEMFIPSSTAAVCLLLSTSPNFCIDKLPQLWTSLLSPAVYQGALVSLVETSFMTFTNSVELDPLMKAFLLTYQAH
jgi:hypothetical protein